MADIKRISIKEWREFGYLQEVNRAFFHPRGLALEVIVNDDGTESLGGIWDDRDDPEGTIFGAGMLDSEKAERVRADLLQRQPLRVAALGYWQQPMPEVAKA